MNKLVSSERRINDDNTDRSEPKDVASSIAVSREFTNTGFLLWSTASEVAAMYKYLNRPASWTLQYLDDLFHSLSHLIRRSHVNLSCITLGACKISDHKHTFVIHTTTGTLRARAMARCSFDIPINPALAPTIRITQDAAPDVKPYNVVFK